MTLQEIASICKVSPATVSLVINDRPGVSDETRKAVLAIVEECGYIKSHSLKKKPKIISIVKIISEDISNDCNGGFVDCIIDQISRNCAENDVGLEVLFIYPDNKDKIIDYINKGGCEGVILLGSELPSDFQSIAKAIGKPMVVMNNYMSNTMCDSIDINHREIAVSAVSYLTSCGFHRIGHLKSSISISGLQARGIGFTEAVRTFGIESFPEDTFELRPSMAGAYQDMKVQIDSKKSLPEAFFADNDEIAIGAIRAIKEKGYCVPEDISIIGIDDISAAAFVSPELTTMHVDRVSLSNLAFDMLLKRISNPKQPILKTQLGAQLIPRMSVNIGNK